jgi:5-methylthioribose kinase
MKNYLIHNNVNLLTNFLCDIIDSFSDDSVYKDYTEVYHHKLSYLSGNQGLIFTKEQLINRLPKKLPQSTYHGDMTLENIIYTNPGFCMIDPLTSDYDSYIFDIAKLRQDLECKWFIRKLNVKIDTKLQRIQEKLKRWYPDAFDDSLLILMLLRVYPYCDDTDKQFIVNEANRLWKL